MKQDQNRRRLCLVLKNASFGRKDAVIPACGAPERVFKGYLVAQNRFYSKRLCVSRQDDLFLLDFLPPPRIR